MMFFNKGVFMIKRIFIAGIASILVACGGGGESEANLTGNWTGTATGVLDGVQGVRTINFALSQNGSTVNGTFNSTSGNAGTVLGSFNGTSFEGSLYPSNPNICPSNFVVFYSDNKLEGTGSTFNCTVAISYTIKIRR